MEDRQKVVKNFCADSELAHFWLFFTPIPADPLAVPGVVDFSEVAAEAKGVAKVVLESMQDMLLRIALQIARDDYEDRRERQRQGIELAKARDKYRGRPADQAIHARIVALRGRGETIANTARLAGASVTTVKRVWAAHCAQGHGK
ncbi:resolvase ParA (plasmid) [Xanthomonas citri pv. mangiferaeindicae]|nr:resolvase ParA [Xanthomonas citri pv. mangiferaeindicae]